MENEGIKMDGGSSRVGSPSSHDGRNIPTSTNAKIHLELKLHPQGCTPANVIPARIA